MIVTTPRVSSEHGSRFQTGDQTWKTVKYGKRSNMENGQTWKTVKHGNGQTWKTVKHGKWSNMENGL